MSRVRWSLRSRRDLLEIGRFISRDDPLAARRWVERLRERARAAAAVPLAGRKTPEFDREDIREVLVRTYRIIYRVREGEIQVLTVLEGRRLLGSEVQGEED
ncbi:MAG TPA: type II toxin-antitoxin system RelE/ParE family toxin [Hyalangium sp.]|jgi:toxin ParE1/3/4|nr:type II toxin-antitoxin system RelE/ParE family toxin [Hyalangium sp.]